MNIKKEIRELNVKDELAAARLAVAYTLLAMAPYDGWGHEGDPAEMAAYVIGVAKDNGNLGRVRDAVLGSHWHQGQAAS